MKERRILESWKEIGAHLNRSTKTCQRWEAEMGLPVHRLDGTPKARVFACTDELDRWFAEKLGDPRFGEGDTAPGGSVRRGLRRSLMPALAWMGAAAIGTGVWLMTRRPAPSPASVFPRLAVLRFTNLTGDPDLDHYRDALQVLCTYDIRQSMRSLNVLTNEAVYGALEKLGLADSERYSLEDLKKVAEQAGADMVLTGSYALSGDSLVISASLQKPFDPAAFEPFEATVPGESNIMDSADRITVYVADAVGQLDGGYPTGMDRMIADVTTSSPRALQLYVQAVKLRYRGKFVDALGLLGEAVRLDPDFAMAYREIDVNNRLLGKRAEAARAYDKAMSLKERLPLNERLFLEGQNNHIPWTERIDIYERLLSYYPGDERALLELGRYYRLVEDRDKAVERLSHGLEVNKKNGFFYGWLAVVYRAMGRYDKCEETLAKAAENLEDEPGILWERGLTYACQGKYDLALSETEKAAALLENKGWHLLRQGNLHYLAGNFARAEEAYREMTRSDSLRLRYEGHYMLGNLYLSLGRFMQAKEELDQAIKFGEEAKPLRLWFVNAGIFRASVDVEAGNVREGREFFDDYLGSKNIPNAERNHQFLFWRGIFSLGLGDVESSERAFEVFEAEIRGASNPGFRQRSALYFRAAIELNKGNSSEAVRLLEKAVSLLPSQHWLGFEESGVYMARETDPHCFYLDLLASAYYQGGQIEKARDIYEQITRLTTGRLWDGHKYAKAFYWLGRIYEQKGWPGKAMEGYGRFLGLWAGADPGIPEVEDARLRLAAIRARPAFKGPAPSPD